MDKYVGPLVGYVLEGLDGETILATKVRQAVPSGDLAMVKQLCSMLDAVLSKVEEVKEKEVFEAIFVFCCVWSIGSLLLQVFD